MIRVPVEAVKNIKNVVCNHIVLHVSINGRLLGHQNPKRWIRMAAEFA